MNNTNNFINNLKNIYTLLGKSWDEFHQKDYDMLRTYFREIIFENIIVTSADNPAMPDNEVRK